MKMANKKIRVGIRGMTGLLGHRLALAISKQEDMEVSLGIVKNDRSLARLLSGNWPVVPEHVFLDEKHQAVRSVNSSQNLVHFRPADQLCLSDLCDIMVDAAAPGNREKWDERYCDFKKPVILQSGEYPFGRLIAPPLISQGNSMIYRQGDCILSVLSPVLAALDDVIKVARIYVVMQYNHVLNDYTTNQRINSTYMSYDQENQISKEIASLFREREVLLQGISQIPGLDYYTITFNLDTRLNVSWQDIRDRLSASPRILIAPKNLTSTYEIDQFLKEEARTVGKDIPPIVVYDNFSSGSSARIVATVYSRCIAVLPNIDAARFLSTGGDPLEAMRLTDK